MSEIIKRVSAVLERAGHVAPDALAEAVIAAMREPTVSMFMQGGDTNVTGRPKGARKYVRIGDEAAANAWRTRIDAVLNSAQREADNGALLDAAPFTALKQSGEY